MMTLREVELKTGSYLSLKILSILHESLCQHNIHVVRFRKPQVGKPTMVISIR